MRKFVLIKNGVKSCDVPESCLYDVETATLVYDGDSYTMQKIDHDTWRVVDVNIHDEGVTLLMVADNGEFLIYADANVIQKLVYSEWHYWRMRYMTRECISSEKMKEIKKAMRKIYKSWRRYPEIVWMYADKTVEKMLDEKLPSICKFAGYKWS